MPPRPPSVSRTATTVTDISGDIMIILKNNDRAKLKFPATTSVIRNAQVVEIPLSTYCQHDPRPHCADLQSANLAVDVHILGFNMIHGIRLDQLGKRFRSLHPTSSIVTEKIKDWRLENALKLVTSTSSFHGGRLVTIKSTFEIINQTSQSLVLALNSDPRYNPNSGTDDVLCTSRHDHMHRKGKPTSATKSGGGESVSLISFLDHRSHASNSTTPVKEWNEYNILEPNGTY